MSRTDIEDVINDSYCLRSSEILVYVDMMKKDPYRALSEIFLYGRAKGYRAAKAEARKKAEV